MWASSPFPFSLAVDRICADATKLSFVCIFVFPARGGVLKIDSTASSMAPSPYFRDYVSFSLGFQGA
jgi:hypothetical protein